MFTKIKPATSRSELTKTTHNDISIPACADDLGTIPLGPFIRLGNGAIAATEGRELVTSGDEGTTWSRHEILSEEQDVVIRPESALLRTREGTLVQGLINDRERTWAWDDDLHDAPGAEGPTYAMRSTDEGRSWTDLTCLHRTATGAIRNMIQTRSGRVVFTSMRFLHKPGRHSVLTYGSDDEGKSWAPSNVIDLGGIGHHGGVTESIIIELKDERLLMYLRTNWGQFWQAASEDGGLYWHPLGPAGIDASSAPGMFHRMQSGRIALLWNRTYPEGAQEYPFKGGDGLWSATPVSNFREELSIAFSEDETQTWSDPVVIARKPETWLAYPYVFEPEPGTMWITTMQGDLRMRLREEDCLR